MIDFLYQTMGIDEEWSIRDDGGFRWWGHEVAQRVRVTEPEVYDGIRVARVISSIDVAVVDPTPKTAGAINCANMMASLSGLRVDREGKVTLNCSMVFHDGNESWVRRVMGLAIGLQHAESAAIAEALGMVGGRPLTSAHPVHGSRPEPDEMLDAGLGFVMRMADSPLPGDDVFEEIASHLNNTGRAVCFASDGSFSGEMPFGSATTLTTVKPVEHPRFGSGLLFLLRLPLPESVNEGADVTFTELIAHKAAQDDMGPQSPHWLGGWCNQDNTPTQALYLPAALCEPGIVMNLTMGVGAQGMYLGERLAGFLGNPPRNVQEVEEALGVADVL